MLTVADHFRICRSSRILPNQKSLILNRALIVTAVEKKQILLFNRRANGAQRAKKPLARLARGCVSIFTIHFLSSVFRACPAAKARKDPSTKTAMLSEPGPEEKGFHGKDETQLALPISFRSETMALGPSRR